MKVSRSIGGWWSLEVSELAHNNVKNAHEWQGHSEAGTELCSTMGNRYGFVPTPTFTGTRGKKHFVPSN